MSKNKHELTNESKEEARMDLFKRVTAMAMDENDVTNATVNTTHHTVRRVAMRALAAYEELAAGAEAESGVKPADGLELADFEPRPLSRPLKSGLTYRPRAEVEAEARAHDPEAYDQMRGELAADLARIDRYHRNVATEARDFPIT